MSVVNSTLPTIRNFGRRVWVIPALLMLVYVGQCLWFVGTQSLTFDEPIHYLTGANAWHGNYNVWNDHPPLARMLFAVPLMVAGFAIDYTGTSPGAIQVHAMSPGPQRAAWLTRPLNVCLGVLLGMLLWLEAHRRWSDGAANFELALFAVSPGMIAHYSVATTDGTGILAVFVLSVMVAWWRREQSVGRTAVLGVVCGFALLAKFYAAPLVAMAMAMVLLSRDQRFASNPREWNWKQALAIAGIAVVLVSAAYGFRLASLRVEQSAMTAVIPGRAAPIVSYFPSPVDFRAWAPAGEYGDGLRNVRRHNFLGHRNYLFGNISKSGWWYYYPTVAALKWPVSIIILGIAGLFSQGRPSSETLLFAAFPVAFAVIALFSHIQIGDRHFLPIYPFLLLGAAALWERLSRRKTWRAVLMGLAVLQAADSLRSAPDYLSYFNVWVRPQDAWRLASDSNVDWGQGLVALKNWQQHNPGTLRLAYFGSVDPKLYGIEAQPLAPGERAKGRIAVSMTNLSGQYLNDPYAYGWLLAYSGEAVVNHSIVVFDVK